MLEQWNTRKDYWLQIGHISDLILVTNDSYMMYSMIKSTFKNLSLNEMKHFTFMGDKKSSDNTYHMTMFW